MPDQFIQTCVTLGLGFGSQGAIAIGSLLIIGSIMPLCMRCTGYFTKMILSGFFLLAVGIAIVAGTFVGYKLDNVFGLTIFSIFDIAVFLALSRAYLLPSFIAARTGRYPYGIIVINLAFFIPFSWFIAFYLALKREKEWKKQNPDGVLVGREVGNGATENGG